MKTGSLEVIVGCMRSGKSLEIIRRLERHMIARKKVGLFKPSADTRDADHFKSRIGKELSAICVDRPGEITERCDEFEVIGIDEANLMDLSIVAAVNDLMEKGKKVLISGLDTDFKGQPFGSIHMIMAIPEAKITRLTAICVKCGEEATRNQRLKDGLPVPADAPVISIEGECAEETYEPRCRDCYELPAG